jgi:PAS domain S-box-containing protein
MSSKNRISGSDDPENPARPDRNDDPSSVQESPLRPADLRTLILSRKESEKQLNLRFSLVQAILEGADSAIFSVDAQGCYTSFNKKHARDMQDLYGSAITAGEKLAGFVPMEKDARKILDLIRLALAGEQGVISDYFGDHARSRRYFDISCYPVRNDAGLITGAAFIGTDTTSRKQSERALIEREDRFRRLAEDAPDLLFRVSLPEGKYEYVSRASLTLTGYPPEVFYKKPGLLYELVHSSGKDAFGRHLDLLMKGNNPPASEFQVVHKNGNVRWWLLRTTLVRDAAGHPIAAEGIITDITDRKKEQIALEETEERFRTIVDSADAGILLVDAETDVIADANPRALEMLRAPREQVIGAACHHFIHPTEAVRFPVTDLGEQVDGSEQIIMAADGRSIPVLRTVVPAKISGRDMLIESLTDLSEQKNTEEALRQGEGLYRAFIANSSEGIFRYAVDCEIPVSLPGDEQIALTMQHGHLAECNDTLARMYGYEQAEELAGQKLGTIMDVNDPRMLDCLHKFIRDGYHVTGYETEERDRAGNLRWFANTLNGIVQDGFLVHFWGVRRDITDRRIAELILRESEVMYRGLVENSVDIIYSLSFSGEITAVNPAVLPLLGYRPPELIGKNIRDFLRPESQQDVQDELDRKKNGDRSDASYEIELRAKDGRFIPFEVNTRTRSEGREGPDITGNAREIAGRKKIEDALRESEERFRILFQCVPSVAVQGFLPDYTVVSWNEATTKMFGYPADEAMGKDIRDLLLPAGARESETETCNRMALTGIPGPLAELDLQHKDGTRVPVLVSHAVVKIPGKPTILFCIGVDLTERKAAETALRDAEGSLQSILDGAPFGTIVYELHDDGSLVFVSGNLSANRILGMDSSQFAGKTIEEAFPALASTGIPDAFRKVARDGEPFRRDAFDYQTEGITGIFEIHAVPLAQNRMTVFFRDISEKIKAERELEMSETLFRSIIRNSPDIIQILDPEKQLVYNSLAFSKILGYPEDSQTGRNMTDLIHPDDRERVMAYLEDVYSRTTPGTPTEFLMLAADGNYLYMESVAMKLPGIPGVDGIVIITHAVHERKQAEHALQESEERFRLMFQYSNDAMYLSEVTPSGMPGKIVDANDVAISQSGYAKDELVQKNLPDLCSRDLSQRLRAIMMELFTRGEARFETEKVKKDGSLLPVEISARLGKLRDKTYIIAISRDISRWKREDRALRIANQKLQLMNIVAWHDIQKKVTDLRGYVEHSKDLVTDEKLKKFIDSEDDILKVIHRQLQYTKEYQEMGIHPPMWVNLSQVLRTIVSFKDIGPLIFRTDLPDLELYCDPVIEKVFSHLIENTQKHAKKATEVHISCRKTADGILLIYEDDGIGIPAEKKKDLFIRGVGSATGFSLFFVHDILEISDMSIQETGEPQKGVRFEISIPRGLYRARRKDPYQNLS